MSSQGRLRLLGAAAALAAVVVVIAIVISQGGSDDEKPDRAATQAAAQERESRQPASLEGIPQDGIMLGDPGAPATLVEFVDLQCPFCADYSNDALPAVIDRYVRTGRLRLELRLLAFLGPDSTKGAQLAAAAGRQDHMWEFVELFYANQGEENSGYASGEFLRGLARRVEGLDVEKAFAERMSPAVERELAEAEAEAGKLGVNATPTLVLRKGSGPPQRVDLEALDAASVTAAIDQALDG